MPFDSFSRRNFFRRAAGAAALGSRASPDISALPQEAWIIVARNWEYNDEFTYEAGESALAKVYFSLGDAQAECLRLCDEFFAGQTPTDFEADFCLYLPEQSGSPEFDESAVSWDELRDGSFPDPFYVQPMEV